MTYSIIVRRREDYSGEHRSWDEEYIIPQAVVDQIITDHCATPLIDITPNIEDAQQAIRYADKFGAVKLDDVTLDILQEAVANHMRRKHGERDTTPDAAALIRFMADFCYNCSTAEGFVETVTGSEHRILRHFRDGHPGWASAASIQSGGSPESHM